MKKKIHTQMETGVKRIQPLLNVFCPTATLYLPLTQLSLLGTAFLTMLTSFLWEPVWLKMAAMSHSQKFPPDKTQWIRDGFPGDEFITSSEWAGLCGAHRRDVHSTCCLTSSLWSMKALWEKDFVVFWAKGEKLRKSLKTNIFKKGEFPHKA